MISRNITIPELGLIAVTRAMLGAGIGLLLADHLKPEQKRAIGWTLLAVGVITTFPLAAEVLSHTRPRSSQREPLAEDSHDPRAELEYSVLATAVAPDT